MRRNMIKAGGAEKVYATFDPDNTSASITLSNENLTAEISINAWRTSFLNISKTSGLWSFEVTPTGPLDNSPFLLIAPGVNDNVNTETFIGAYANGLMNNAWEGSLFRNGARFATKFDALNGLPAAPLLVVCDFDSWEIICIKSGFLVYTSVPSFTQPEFIGLSMLSASGTFGGTLNAGQSPFSTSNEAAIVAFEAAEGVTVNRGVYI